MYTIKMFFNKASEFVFLNSILCAWLMFDKTAVTLKAALFKIILTELYIDKRYLNAVLKSPG